MELKNPSLQCITVSATLPNDVIQVCHIFELYYFCIDDYFVYIEQIADKFLRNPRKILVKQEEITLQGIKQFYVDVGKEEHKLETICDLYEVKLILNSSNLRLMIYNYRVCQLQSQ